MTVYVDTMRAAYGRMIMCHMIADTDDELHAMADAIGVARKWHQNTVSGSHYDIALSKKKLAIANGAREITLRQAAAMTGLRRRFGVPLPAPEDAENLLRTWRSAKRQRPATIMQPNWHGSRLTPRRTRTYDPRGDLCSLFERPAE